MAHKRPPVPVLVLLALIILVGGYFLIAKLTARTSTALSASGTIEAVTISLAPEIGGKVAEVFVDEGDQVQAGDPLFRLDDTLLNAQRQAALVTLDVATATAATARAAQASAQASYDLAAATARLEASPGRTADWNSEFGSAITQAEELLAANIAYDLALAASTSAQEQLTALLADPASAAFASAENRLLTARTSNQVAQSVLARANASANADLRTAAQDAADLAQQEQTAAQDAYDEVSGTSAARAVLLARAELAVALETASSAHERMLSLQTGDYSLRLAVAAATLTQATAAAAQAHLAIAQAEASLAVLDAQIAKLTISAPTAGIILTRSIQPGEVIPAGATALKLARLDDLTITVYIPEDRYGELSLGQSAVVSADSFPGQAFPAVITNIANEAEFTPRNVQTVAGRSSTVYAIRLQVEDPRGRLKPGMPADVTFTLPSAEE